MPIDLHLEKETPEAAAARHAAYARQQKIWAIQAVLCAATGFLLIIVGALVGGDSRPLLVQIGLGLAVLGGGGGAAYVRSRSLSITGRKQ